MEFQWESQQLTNIDIFGADLKNKMLAVTDFGVFFDLRVISFTTHITCGTQANKYKHCYVLK